MDHCPLCGEAVEPTGAFTDHYVTDLPEPTVEVHRYRRHVYRCRGCQKQLQGRADLEVPGSTVGPRTRLLSVYSRAYLGISLGKSNGLLQDLFGLALSRAGALEHLRWFARHFDPVVQQLLGLLQAAPVVFADETGWRIDGKDVWCWCFSKPAIAVFLVDQHRSRAVIERALGARFAGVLVSDFYAAYNSMGARQQRCLVHLLRALASLRASLPTRLVAKNIQPLMALVQDAIALGKQRATLDPAAFAVQKAAIQARFDERWWRQSGDPDCQRIYERLRRHRDELLVFLDEPQVPPDNNRSERDIRSVAAARSECGVNRSRWGANAFAVAKSIVRTSQKSGVNFFRYALGAVAEIQAGQPAPLPVPDTS